MRRGCSYFRFRFAWITNESSMCDFTSYPLLQYLPSTWFIKRLLITPLICFFICCSHTTKHPNEKDVNVSKNVISKGRAHVRACHETAAEFLPSFSLWWAIGELGGKPSEVWGLLHILTLFPTEQLLFNCQKRSASQCAGVCLVTTNTRHVFIRSYFIRFLQRLNRHS